MATPSPRDHCDTPLIEDSDILAALSPGDTLDDLTAADLEHVTAACSQRHKADGRGCGCPRARSRLRR